MNILERITLATSVRVLLGAMPIYEMACDAAPGSAGQYCGSDKDCKGDRLCVKGVCEGSGSSSNIPNNSSNYDCNNFCAEIIHCSSDSNDGNCVSTCENDLDQTTQSLFKRGCVTTTCQNLIEPTYFGALKCLTQTCDKGQCNQYQDNFKAKTGINW